jgi:dipeptidase E
VQLHLFSAGNQDDELGLALEACRDCLRGKQDATIAYLPLGTLFAEKWLARIKKAFAGVARIEPINTETMDLRDMEGILRGAAAAYLPGGNAFLLNNRLHVSQLMPRLRKKVRNGLPLVAVDAGAVVCGPNVLTANDLNMVPTPHFNSLDLTPFNLHIGYTDDVGRDAWLAEYHAFHDNPVLMLEDGACVEIDGKRTRLSRGRAWCLRAGSEKEQLTAGEAISAY